MAILTKFTLIKNIWKFLILVLLNYYVFKEYTKTHFVNSRKLKISSMTSSFIFTFDCLDKIKDSNEKTSKGKLFFWSPAPYWDSQLLNFIDAVNRNICKIQISFFIVIFVVWMLIVLLLAIFATALLTLKERSVLATVQLRKGPNKVSYGFLQPIADAFKLILKEFIIPNKSYKNIYINIASFGFICSSSLIVFIPFSYSLIFSNNEFSFLFIFFFNLLHVYAILLSGWSSKSKYSFLGAVRSSSQLISYDIALALIVIHVFCYVKSLSILNVLEYQTLNLPLFLLMPAQALLFIVIGAAETSRHPFDLPEAEPELVSGYNVEYSAIRFALFFLSEYLSVILFSNLVVIVFFGGWSNYLFFQSFEYILKISIIIFIIIKLRALLPRYRVDQLMRVCWKYIIPFELLSLLFNLVCIFLNV